MMVKDTREATEITGNLIIKHDVIGFNKEHNGCKITATIPSGNYWAVQTASPFDPKIIVYKIMLHGFEWYINEKILEMYNGTFEPASN